VKLQKDSATVLEELQVSPLIIVTVINENMKKNQQRLSGKYFYIFCDSKMFKAGSGFTIHVRTDLKRCMADPCSLATLPLASLRRLQDTLLKAWEVRKTWLRQHGLLKTSNSLDFARALWEAS